MKGVKTGFVFQREEDDHSAKYAQHEANDIQQITAHVIP
jgi:hypothetical protein